MSYMRDSTIKAKKRNLNYFKNKSFKYDDRFFQAIIELEFKIQKNPQIYDVNKYISFLKVN
jgi:hypothetical protein